MQPFCLTEDDRLTVLTVLGHTSGARATSTSTFYLARKEKGNPWHDLGTAITYCRRYALQAMICVAPEEDDDAATAVPMAPPRRAEPPKPQPRPDPQPQANRPAQVKPAAQKQAPKVEPQRAEDSPEAARAALEETPAPKPAAKPDPLDAPYSTDPNIGPTLNRLFGERRISAPECHRFCLETFGIRPDELTEKLSIRQARVLITAIEAASPCTCAPGVKVCAERGRLRTP